MSKNLHFHILDCLYCFDDLLCIFLSSSVDVIPHLSNCKCDSFQCNCKKGHKKSFIAKSTAAKIQQLDLMYGIRKVALMTNNSSFHFGDAENMLLAILMIYVTFCCDIMTLCREFVQFRTCNE